MKVGKKVVVVGGGNVAVDAARTSARLGGEDVQMFCLESRETMPASDEEVEETLAENIAINNGWGPKEFLKDKNGKVTGVVFKKCLSVFDENHKFAPKYDENDTITVEADYVIKTVGIVFALSGIVVLRTNVLGLNCCLKDGERHIYTAIQVVVPDDCCYISGNIVVVNAVNVCGSSLVAGPCRASVSAFPPVDTSGVSVVVFPLLRHIEEVSLCALCLLGKVCEVSGNRYKCYSAHCENHNECQNNAKDLFGHFFFLLIK